jgi:hypothetical protein
MVRVVVGHIPHATTAYGGAAGGPLRAVVMETFWVVVILLSVPGESTVKRDWSGFHYHSQQECLRSARVAAYGYRDKEWTATTCERREEKKPEPCWKDRDIFDSAVKHVCR